MIVATYFKHWVLQHLDRVAMGTAVLGGAGAGAGVAAAPAEPKFRISTPLTMIDNGRT
jgi:hypothetical protein